jgi:hypothetical protein
MYSLGLLLALSLLPAENAPVAGAECDRTPVSVRLGPTNTPYYQRWHQVERLLAATHPGLRIRHADGITDFVYLEDKGGAYEVSLRSDIDEESGLAVLAVSYTSSARSAISSGRKMAGDGCREAVEIVIARMRATGSPEILMRGQVDDEAATIDVRSLDIDRDEDGQPIVKTMYHAYYGRPGWFGYVTWRAAIGIERGRLVTQRLPATYVKYSGSAENQMQGYLAPAGGDPSRGIARLLIMAFGSGGEVEKHIEVPVVDRRWISGVEIMRQVP